MGLDYAIFVVAVLLTAGGVEWALRRGGRVRGSGRFSIAGWGLLLLLLGAGWWATAVEGRRERGRIEGMVQGFAPTYARELERMGHASIGVGTAPDDPLYLAMIDAQKRWCAANPAIADIYTFRRTADGRTILMVDAETDYDGDADYVDEREARTPIGEVYEGDYESLDRAFAGEPCFDTRIVTDRWGTWVSAFEPMRDARGRVEAVLGVDYDAHRWLARIGRARAVAIGCTGVVIALFLGAGSMILRLRSEVDERRRTHRELVAARDAAADAARARFDFLARMSHELRTPLHAIVGFTELLDSGARASAQAPEWVRTVRRNAEHLLGLVNDKLDLSKIDAGQLTVERVPCRPAEILAEAEATVRPHAAAKGLGLVVEPAPDLPVILSDPFRLRQVLLNLLGNAVKFTDCGEVRVNTACVPPDPPVSGDGAGLRFTIADTGIGMTPEQVGRLFRPFAQADSSTTRRFGGTGLGLAISRQLARLLGGDITVSSQPGRGSTFTLYVRADSATTPERAAEAAALPRLHARILLAEDGPDNQHLLRYQLRLAGAEVDVADNGRIAEGMERAAVVQGRPYDLVLLDMNMPEVDGYTAAALMRSRGRGGPILALTANALSDDRERSLAAGCDDYLTKPIERERLIRVCARWLAVGTGRVAA